MAKLPGYDSTRGITIEPAVQLDDQSPGLLERPVLAESVRRRGAVLQQYRSPGANLRGRRP